MGEGQGRQRDRRQWCSVELVSGAMGQRTCTHSHAHPVCPATTFILTLSHDLGSGSPTVEAPQLSSHYRPFSYFLPHTPHILCTAHSHSVPTPSSVLSLCLPLPLSLCLPLPLPLCHPLPTFNFLSSLTYLASGLSGSQSSWPCQKYLVLCVSLTNLAGRGPRMASIMARCSRLS